MTIGTLPATFDARLRLARERALVDRHVFVVGMARSGTTALEHRLELHPAFRAVRGESLETRALTPGADLFRRGGAMVDRTERWMGLDHDGLDQFDADIERIARWRRPVARVARRVAPSLLTSPRAWEAVRGDAVRLTWLYASVGRGAPRVLEKTPAHLLFLDRVLRVFPRARVVASVREPVAVLASRRKRGEAERSGQGSAPQWLSFSVPEFADVWRRDVEAARAAVTDPRVTVVRYEDLLRDPDTVLRGIVEFVGEEWRPTVATAVNRGGSGDAAAPIRPVSDAPSAWVDQSEATELRRLVGPSLAAFGYGDV